MTLLLCLVLGQLVADFILQPDDVRLRRPVPVVVHAAGIGAVSFLASLLLRVELAAGLLLAVVAAHAALDYLHELLSESGALAHTWLFTGDQVLHVIVTWALVQPLIELPVVEVSAYGLPAPVLSTGEFYLVAAIIMMFSIFGSARLIPMIMDQVLGRSGSEAGGTPGEGEAKAKQVRTGRYIGILERIFIFVVLLTRQPAGLGVLVAVKSLARYHEYIRDSEFAEQYLIGTMLSFIFAILPAGVILWLWSSLGSVGLRV